MKKLLFVLFTCLFSYSYAAITTSCDQDYYTTSEMGEYYFHERMEVLNKDGELVGNILFGNDDVDGLFLCGAREVTGKQFYFGFSRSASYEDLITDSSVLDRVSPYFSYNDTHSVEFYNTETVSETNTAYIIETTIRMRSINTGRFVAAEKVQIRLRKYDYLYE